MPKVTEELITRAARTAHEVNRIYALSLGDGSQTPWEEAPEDMRRSVIAGVRYVLRYPNSTPREMHDAWVEYKKQDGWTWGIVKDFDAKTHPSLVPYQDLPVFEKLKDSLFQTVVRGVLGV